MVVSSYIGLALLRRHALHLLLRAIPHIATGLTAQEASLSWESVGF